MKWLLVAACLSCDDPNPFPVAEVTDVDRETCLVLAGLALEHALPMMPDGAVAAAWCEPLDDWQGVDAYPQRRR